MPDKPADSDIGCASRPQFGAIYRNALLDEPQKAALDRGVDDARAFWEEINTQWRMFQTAVLLNANQSFAAVNEAQKSAFADIARVNAAIFQSVSAW